MCKRVGYRNVDILKISDSSFYKSIRFSNKDSKQLCVNISKDLDKIFLNNETDNILFYENKQVVLSRFKQKRVHKLLSTTDNNFLAIVSNSYANGFHWNLHLRSSNFSIWNKMEKMSMC